MSWASVAKFSLEAEQEHAIEVEAFRSEDSVPGQKHMFKDAQDHIPLGYAIARHFVTQAEIDEMHDWFCERRHQGLRLTEFNGDPLEWGQESEVEGDPIVRQLYGNPGPFMERFPELYHRIVKLKNGFGSALKMDQEELDRVDFAQDIRYITYKDGDYCPWHRDDPTSHFNTIMMISRPGIDFEGGVLQFHPVNQPTDINLNLGDAVIYATPKVDHSVTKCTRGVRKICLVEMKFEDLAEKAEVKVDLEE